MQHQSVLKKRKNKYFSKQGVNHWLHQRWTSIVNIPVALWFIYALLQGKFSAYTLKASLAQPEGFFNLGFMTLLALTFFGYHAYLGIQNVVEDYIHTAWKKRTLLTVLLFSFLGLWLLMLITLLGF